MRPNKPSYFSLTKLNPVVRFLTLSDILIMSGMGLVSPIFAIFIVDSIPGATIEAVGIATTIFLISKSLLLIPAGIIIDKIKGEKDDFWIMFFGSLVFSFIPLVYLVIDTTMELYIVQFFYGLASAITYPSWLAIFTRHIDKNMEGIEWSVYHTMIDIGAAGTAAIGGLIAARFGFFPLFATVSLVSFVGTLFLLMIQNKMRKTT